MNTQKITGDITWVGVDDHITPLFEGLWPLEKGGISYNAYVIEDEKIAVIDAVRDCRSADFLDKIRAIIGDHPVDYLVVNHMEPDHSSGIDALRAAYPAMEIIVSKKAVPMLENFYGITEGIRSVGEGETLELGRHTLSFSMTPMVHWPESMVTYDAADKVLFSMDIFGSFRATDGVIFDDEADVEAYIPEYYRYFSCIIGKVCGPAKKALTKVSKMDIAVLCPSHGLIWRKNPQRVIDLYQKMAASGTEPGVVIAYGTMYGNTRHSAELLAGWLKEAGVGTVILHDVAATDMSYIFADIWRYKGLLLGAPAYYGRIYPKMAAVLYKLEEIKTVGHALGCFTDFSWSGGAEKPFASFVENSGGFLVGDTVQVKGRADEEEEAALKRLAFAMAKAVLNN